MNIYNVPTHIWKKAKYPIKAIDRYCNPPCYGLIYEYIDSDITDFTNEDEAMLTVKFDDSKLGNIYLDADVEIFPKQLLRKTGKIC